MTPFFKKIAAAFFLGLASTGIAAAETAIIPLTCPKLETLNSIMKKNPADLNSFADQGFTWAIKTELKSTINTFTSFSKVTVPTMSSPGNLISCEYYQKAPNGVTFVSRFETSVSGQVFKGQTGNWAIFGYGNSSQQCTSEQRVDTCIFVKKS